MANKRQRQATVLELVNARVIGSQEELRKLLLQRGWDVTQATLSRDLRDLRLARIPTEDGVRYALADSSVDDSSRPRLETLLPSLFTRVEGVSELIVLRTLPGGAQPIAVAIDAEGWSEVLGTLAGDDTILLICRSSAARERMVRRIRKIAQNGE